MDGWVIVALLALLASVAAMTGWLLFLMVDLTSVAGLVQLTFRVVAAGAARVLCSRRLVSTTLSTSAEAGVGVVEQGLHSVGRDGGR